jgi:hypothetical protein
VSLDRRSSRIRELSPQQREVPIRRVRAGALPIHQHDVAIGRHRVAQQQVTVTRPDARIRRERLDRRADESFLQPALAARHQPVAHPRGVVRIFEQALPHLRPHACRWRLVGESTGPPRDPLAIGEQRSEHRL